MNSMRATYREEGTTIDYTSNVNRMILKMAERGYSTYCIQQQVNKRLHRKRISLCQISYRLQQTRTLLRKFRDGETDFAKKGIQKVVIQLYPVRKVK